MTSIPAMNPKQNVGVTSGFTLIELLTVIVIIGILVTIGYPSYQKYVIRANRAEAQQVILDIANRQEEFLLNNRRYGTCCNDTDDLRNIIPERVQALYIISATPGENTIPPTYNITAKPKTGSIQIKDNDTSCQSDSTNTGLTAGEMQMNSELKKIPKCRWK